MIECIAGTMQAVSCAPIRIDYAVRAGLWTLIHASLCRRYDALFLNKFS